MKRSQQEVWPPGSAGTVCLRRSLMTQVQHWADWAKTAQTDHVTLRPWPLTLEVMAPVADAGRRPPSVYQVWTLKFVGLAIRKIWRTMCVSVNGPGDLLTFKLVCESHQRRQPFFQIWARYAFGFSNYLPCTRRTDGRTDKTLIAPFPTSGA